MADNFLNGLTISDLVEVKTAQNDDVLIIEGAQMTNKITKGNLLKEINEKIEGIGTGGGGMTAEEKEQLVTNTHNIDKILKIIDEPPTYIKPTLTVSVSPNTIQHNTSTAISIKPNFTKNDSGEISSYTLQRNGTVIYTDTTQSTYTDTISLSHNSSTTYTATVGYLAGGIKTTSMGIEYPQGRIEAGEISASNSVRAFALSYIGVVSQGTISENDISSLTSRLATSRAYTYTTNLSNQRIVYMYPKTFGALTSIKDSNNFDYINSYTRSEMTYNGVDYYVYILTDPVTITVFKQIFN